MIDLTDGDRSAFLSWVSGAPVRIGFNDEHRWRGKYYTQVVPSAPGVQHRIDRDLEALKPLNIQAVSKDPQLWVTPEDRTVPIDCWINSAFSDRSDGDIAARRPILV